MLFLLGIALFIYFVLGTSIRLPALGKVTQQAREFSLALPIPTVPPKGAFMSATTPIARSKTAALARILDCIPKGYFRYTHGVVKPEKAKKLAEKLHQRHAIGATVAQRMTRKRHGKANALLVMYWPEDTEFVSWLMLFTDGSLDFHEQLISVTNKPKLVWLGYELARYAHRGTTSWTWRRTKTEMAQLHALMAEQLNRHFHRGIAETLQRVARQPGFHGIRDQSRALCEEAKRRGFRGETPTLNYVQKISHGDTLILA